MAEQVVFSYLLGQNLPARVWRMSLTGRLILSFVRIDSTLVYIASLVFSYSIYFKVTSLGVRFFVLFHDLGDFSC